MWQPTQPVFGRHFCAWLLAMALLGAAPDASARSGRQVHVVYQGQRLGSIAKRYNVSIEAICQANGISRRDTIRPGQRLEIPSREEAKKAALEKTALSPSSSAPPPVAAEASSKPAARADKAPLPASATKSAAAKAASSASDKPSNKPAAEAKPAASSKAAPLAAVTSAKDATKKDVTKAASLDGGGIDPVTLGITQSGVSHRVKAGESLSSIAVHYDTSVKTLLQANQLSRDKVIRVGQVLVIPRAASNGTWWGKFARAPKRAGEVEVFAHHAHSIRWKGKVVAGGKVQPSARAALSRLLGATGSAPPVPERLLQLLTHVSDTFGGRPIRLVSGYRTSSYVKDSRHRHSSAIDFSIEGVPNSAVRDYLLQLGNVGVGYYPNSTFVHLDVRARSAYWVDYAGPGEAPRKTPRGDTRFASNAHPSKSEAATLPRFRRITGVRASKFAAPELVASGPPGQRVRDEDERSTVTATSAPEGASATPARSSGVGSTGARGDSAATDSASASAATDGSPTSNTSHTTAAPRAADAAHTESARNPAADATERSPKAAPATPPGPKPVTSDASNSSGT